MKRPSDNAEKPDGFNKRRRPNKVTGNGAGPKLKPENIQTLRQLQSLFGDFSKPEELNNGIQCFKAFLNRCSKGGEVPDEVVDFNLKLLKEWLEVQSKRTTGDDAGESQINAFGDILQVWSYASQKNTLSVLSSVVSSLAWVVRICSQNEDLRPSGFVLCKAILQQSYLKIIYRTLVSNREHVVAPCLRMLTEINRFDHGSACGILHSAFDFTVKDITRNLEVRGGKVETTDDSRRPTIRTTFLRFITSFFQYGSSNIKNQILGLRTWISPLFKYLRIDSPVAINEVMGALSKYIMDDKEILRATKTAVFNEWVLGHIAGLYGRQERVTISKAGKEEEKPIAEIAHEFLMSVCTTPGNGICFPSSGWYPQGSVGGEEKRRGSGPPKVHNRTLSLFISAIRPYADTLQQDLLLAIFRACPELVASYFILNSSFSFDPKLTSTWIGYCGFLTAAIELPIPDHFGLAELSPTPPSTSVVIENVIPKPLTKAVLTKCISHESSRNLIKFLTTRLLVISFQKLRKVLSALDKGSSSMIDPSTNWLRMRFELIEEFCKRVPDMSIISGLIKLSPGQGMLQKEAATRLLADYYETLPEVAFAGNFDITLTLGTLLIDEEGPEGQAAGGKGLRFLEIHHLLRVAKDAPDIKWWNKPSTMSFSPFVSVLKACCGPSSSFPLRQIKTLLQSLVAPSLLFQAETSVSPLEALLESLSVIAQPATSEAALVFLDESISRCIRTPFKYIDDYAELVMNISKSREQGQGQGIAAVSPLVMTIVEQFKFFAESNAPHEVKLGVSTWLARFMGSCAILGENGHVLAALCNRLVKLCGCDKSSESIFKLLKQDLEEEGGFQLVSRRSHESTSKREPVSLLQRAASLPPSLDEKKAFQNMVQDNRRNNLTVKTVDLIDSLIDSQETADIRGRVLIALDFLTRRFAEDGSLSEEVLRVTKRVGGLFAQERVGLSTLAPRVALNAVLESGLQKRIDTPEIVYFVSVMVSQLPPKSLDAGKLLQIVLGHSKNPLLFRDDTPNEISHHIAFIIYCLFSATRLSQSTITTLDGVLGLYRGTNDIIDTALLNIIWSIEGHLAQSCANRIADWLILERAEGKPFISRVRGRLFVAMDSKKLARSVFQYSPRKAIVSDADLKTFELFMGALTERKETDSRTYNPEFLLPALTYCLLSENIIIDVQAAVEKHTLGFAIMDLCSYNKSSNSNARSYIKTVISKLEASTYRERTQILHLLCAILASSTSYERLGTQPLHIPTVVGVFLAQIVQVLSNPSHFLYEKVMEHLLRQPLLNLHDVPDMVSLSSLGEEYHKEVFWILNVLEAGLKTEKDLDLYRKRNVFGNCLNVYNSPYTSDKEKEKIIELLWNAAGVEGGGTTLITRNGIISWTESQLSGTLSVGNRILMKRLGARLFESSAKEYVKEWSKGNIEYHLHDGILVK